MTLENQAENPALKAAAELHEAQDRVAEIFKAAATSAADWDDFWADPTALPPVLTGLELGRPFRNRITLQEDFLADLLDNYSASRDLIRATVKRMEEAAVLQTFGSEKAFQAFRMAGGVAALVTERLETQDYDRGASMSFRTTLKVVKLPESWL